MRQVLCAIEQRVDNVLAIAVEHRFELATAQRLAKGPGRHHPLSYLYADLAPLVDDPKGIELVGLIDIAVEQLESQPLGACFLQQPPRLGPRLFYVRPVAGQLLQFCPGRRKEMECSAAWARRDRQSARRHRTAGRPGA